MPKLSSKLLSKLTTPRIIIVSLLIAAVGLAALLGTSAATPFLSVEPENGTLGAPATTVSDATASGSQAVRFTPGTTPGNFASHALYNNAARLVQTQTGQRSSQLDSISGLAASQTLSGIYWANNDSGSPPQIFAINQAGAVQATRPFSAGTIGAADYEDIAVGPGPDASASYVYLAGVGDNPGTRSFISIYRMKEPSTVTGATLSADRIDIRYPDGGRNCEAFFVDPATGDWWLLEKKDPGTGAANVYRIAGRTLAASSAGAGTPNVLQKQSFTLNFAGIRGASIAPDRGAILVRQGHNTHIYKIATTSTTIAAALQSAAVKAPADSVTQAQVEAIGFAANSQSYLIASEQSGLRTVLRFSAP